MRTYTLVVSVIAHVAMIAALVIAPALATDVLPAVRRTTAFIVVRPELPAPPRREVARREAPSPSAAAAPVVEPDSVQPEIVPAAVPADPGLSGPAAPGFPVAGVGVGVEPLPPPAPVRPKDPVRVGSVIRAPSKIRHVDPVYPPVALAARKEGLVILEAVIGETGEVREVRVLRSNPLFDEAAVAAVRQWIFTPTLLHGEPVPIVMTVTVTFSLAR